MTQAAPLDRLARAVRALGPGYSIETDGPRARLIETHYTARYRETRTARTDYMPLTELTHHVERMQP